MNGLCCVQFPRVLEHTEAAVFSWKAGYDCGYVDFLSAIHLSCVKRLTEWRPDEMWT
jgi:hypothetical protein